MLMIVRCTHCSEEGQFDVHLTFMYHVENCDKGHLHTSEWTFNFCDLDCMSEWLEANYIKTKGIPCQSCHETGWAFGFEQNGLCDVCKGIKRVLTCANKL